MRHVSRDVFVQFGLLHAVAAFAIVLGLCAVPKSALAADPATEAEKIPEPEDVDLVTKDGVTLCATYYASLLGKEAVPVILLHGYKGDRRDFNDLALALQRLGHAVIAPDLRGHGESVNMDVNGQIINLQAGKLRRDDFLLMSEMDVETVKKFLMKLNNAGKLNIDKLCVVGAEMGATVAINWAMLDWSWPPLATGKQGQDVKALVLISPEWGWKGLPITKAMAMPAIRQNMSVLLINGKGAKNGADAMRVYKGFEKSRPEPPSDPKEAAALKDLFLVQPETSLQGTKMLNEKALNLYPRVAQFIELRLSNKRFPWTDRTNKLTK